jgi:hypothetical protein
MLGGMLKNFGSIFPLYILLPMGMLHGFTAQKNVYDNHIAAYVEDRIITKQQLESEVMLMTNQNVLKSEPESALRAKALDALLEKRMIIKEFERLKGQIPESYIQKRYDEVQKTRFDDDSLQLVEALHRQGKSRTSYKAELREEVIVSCMYERNVHKPNVVSPLDIQNYYQTHGTEWVQGRRFDIDQITLEKGDSDALLSVQECFKYPYETCCQHLSQIPNGSFQHMENIGEDEVLPIIAEKIAGLSVGSFTPEFIELGEKIIFLGLRNVREARVLSINEVWENIEQTLSGERYQCLRQKWLDQLKQKAYCVIL